MVTTLSISPRARALQRTFAAAFDAAKEHAKQHPHEVALLYEIIASHLRSASPMSLEVTMPLDSAPVPLDPETSVRRDLDDGAAYELRIDNSLLMVRIDDVTGDNAMVHLDPQRGRELRDDLGRVLAAMGVR